MDRRLQKTNWLDTRRGVQLEHFFVLNIPISQHDRRLIASFILQKNIAHPKQKKLRVLTSSFLFLANTQTESAQRTMCIEDQNCGYDTVDGRF